MKRTLSRYRPVSLDTAYLIPRLLDTFAASRAGMWRAMSGRQKTDLKDLFENLLVTLEQCLATGSGAFLDETCCQAMHYYPARKYPEQFVSGVVAALEDSVVEFPAEYRTEVSEFLTSAKKAMGPDTCTMTAQRMSRPARSLLSSALSGDEQACIRIVQDHLDTGIPAGEIYRTIFVPVLVETGRLWLVNRAGIGQEHAVTAIVRRCMDHVRNQFPLAPADSRPPVVAACAGAELHEIGIRMAADHLLMNGWQVYYIGSNAPAQSIVDAVQGQKAGIAILSVTMPARLRDLDYLIRSLRAGEGTRTAGIIVGGHPFRLVPGLWKTMGADCGIVDPGEAPARALELLAARRKNS